MRGHRRIDLRVDPPPDLAVEVDVTRSSLNRMAIDASLGVPEVWRLDNATDLPFQVLQADGAYAAADRSRAFPLLSPADLLRFLALRGEEENTIVRQFRKWLRQQLPA